MNFGDYLKSRRTELGWTQPEAAAKVRIEQSYLSKLENGRSIPSEEVYQRIAAAYGLDTEAMVVSLYPAELDRLREIEAVRKHLFKAAQNTGAARRGWLYAGLAALVLGGGLIGLSQTSRGGTVTQYTYQSSGVILPGESLDVFAGVDDNPDPADPSQQARLARRDSLLARIDEKTISIPDMRGPVFLETVPEGRRAWHLVGAGAVTRPDRYGWALIPGFALALGGLGCFLISWLRP